MRFLKLTIIVSLALGLLLGLSVLVMQPAAMAAATGMLQTLIDNAPNGGTINVSPGTYTESLTVNKTLTLTGVSSSTTIIQAVTGQRVITVTAGHDLRLENLAVTGGQSGGGGGGIYLQNGNGSLTLVNCRIANNSATYGGGVFQEGASGRVDVIGSRIELNTSTNHGGGLYVNGSAAFTNTLVLSNTASFHGGGVHVQTGRVDVSDGVFSNNRAQGGNGGAINLNGNLSLSGTLIVSNTALNGGGVQQWNPAPTVLITNTRFERNLARSIGGGAAISGTLLINGSTFATNTVDSGNASSTFGGGLYAGISGQIFATTFSGNSALCLNGGSCSNAEGGGLYNGYGSLTLTNVIFQSNKAGRMGGGISSVYSSPVLTNVIFSGNKAGWGGGLYHDTGSPRLTNVLFSGNEAGWAGGMLASFDSPILKHVTFSGNDGYNQGGGLLNYYGTPTLINSIVWGNIATNGPEIFNDHGTITATYSNIKFTGVYTGVGNINADPRFALPITYTAAPTTTGNYHLQSGSPAIDHGTNGGVTTDLDGRKRPLGNGYDMGAYESPLYAYLPLVLK
jgi:predicted outer membrane repeat protein